MLCDVPSCDVSLIEFTRLVEIAVRYVAFEHLEEARYDAGFFVDEVIQRRGRSERTYYRWKRDDRAPRWAHELTSLYAGDLSAFGLPKCRPKHGVIFHADLECRHHRWPLQDLLAEIVSLVRQCDSKDEYPSAEDPEIPDGLDNSNKLPSFQSDE